MIKGLLTEVIISLEEFTGTAMPNLDYELIVNGEKYPGKLDGSGSLKVSIDADAKTGELVIYLDSARKNSLFWQLEFGALENVVDVSGIQARLNNLGYYCANENGQLDNSTQTAIRQFKAANGLPANAQIEPKLVEKLKQTYGF
ncbi:MAG: hypothetical protein CMI13_12605 [Oleibacter sp.]|nr:hypothetical protein [Thalassolituus sp.]